MKQNYVWNVGGKIYTVPNFVPMKFNVSTYVCTYV